MFTGLPLLDRFYLSYIWLYALWLDYDVSLHDLVELVASFDSSSSGMRKVRFALDRVSVLG